jgi:tetratricopeptide (TPR) repeat protein
MSRRPVRSRVKSRVAPTLTPPERGPRRSAWFLALPFALIVATGILVYANSLQGPFIWDDETAIVTNPTIRQLWPLSGPLVPPGETPMAGRPLANLTLALNYAAGALDVVGYRIFNLLLHIGCALLLFVIIRRTLRGRSLAGRFGETAGATALVASLLWMVHPLQSEVVNYVTQRTESLAALCLLLTLYSAIRARHGASGIWSGLAATCCALGMASKESMVIAPLVVVLYDRVFEFKSLRDALRTRTHLYGGLAATWVLLAILVVTTDRSTVSLSGDVTSMTYLWNQFQMVTTYLRLSVWPDRLVLDYGLPHPLALVDVAREAALVGTLVIMTLTSLVRWPRVGFLGAVFFLALAPTSTVLPILSEVGSERRMYVPMMAVSVLAAVLVRMFVDWTAVRMAGRGGSLPEIAGATLIIASLCAGALTTARRNDEFADRSALWKTVVDRRPHGRARLSYGVALRDAGRSADALDALREAVVDYPDAGYVLGTELFFAGEIDEASGALQRFIEEGRSENFVPARSLLARALIAQGEFEAAMGQYESILEMAPTNLEALSGLAETLFTQERYEESAVAFQRVSDRIPTPTAQNEIRWGVALSEAGQSQEAVAHLEKALEIDPRSATAHLLLADLLLVQRDRPGDAEPHARAALELTPDDGRVHHLLAIVLARTDRLDEAVSHFREASRLRPDDPMIRADLERAVALSDAVRTGDSPTR